MPEDVVTDHENTQDKLQEEYLDALDQVKEGSLIEGKVIQIDSEYVYLDVRLKSDGKVSIDEFQTVPEINDMVEVLLLKREGTHGEVIISKKKAERKSLWKSLRDAWNNNLPITGTVGKSVKGGFEVEIGCGTKAFCPISKMDVHRIDNTDDYIGKEYSFLIDKLFLGEKRVNIVLTRRQWLENEMALKREAFFAATNIGDEVEGIVRSFTSFGAFIDLGGFHGLLHINDISWGHITRPRDYIKKGEKIKLKIIRLDPDGQRINLSLKHLQPDPWEEFEKHYQVGQIIKGRVTKLTDFGAFIEIEEGVEGLAHISEFSWGKRIKHPKDIFSQGDKCEAMILGYDIPQERISLGLKQILPNPWDDAETKYPVGTRGNWLVKKITSVGAFVELEEGIDAFLHADDISWTRKTKNLSTVLKENESIEAVVISVEAENKRIRLGIKQLTEDPWESFPSQHPRGSIVKCIITGKTDFGVFVKVGEDIKGLIHKNNLPANQEENADEKLASLNEGDEIEAAVLEINVARKKLALSIREVQYRQEQAEISQYMDDGSDDGKDSYTLGDILKG